MSQKQKAAVIASLIVPMLMVAVLVVGGRNSGASGSSVKESGVPAAQQDEGLPARVPVLLQDGRTGYFDRDSWFRPDKPTPKELNGREGTELTDEAGAHVGWFIVGYGALSDDEAAKYAQTGDPGIPNPIISSSAYEGYPTGFNSSSGH